MIDILPVSISRIRNLNCPIFLSFCQFYNGQHKIRFYWKIFCPLMLPNTFCERIVQTIYITRVIRVLRLCSHQYQTTRNSTTKRTWINKDWNVCDYWMKSSAILIRWVTADTIWAFPTPNEMFVRLEFSLQLLLKPKFSGIEKIKTIGSTYMTASGLRPGKEEGAMVCNKLIRMIHNCSRVGSMRLNQNDGLQVHFSPKIQTQVSPRAILS